MATDITLPQLGSTMTEGKIVDWLKAAGAPVERGEAVAEVETDKVTVEIEAPTDGILGPILVESGNWVPVGTILATVLAAGEVASGATGDAAPAIPVHTEQAPPAIAPVPQETTRILVSPRARNVAQELGVELSQVTGSGPGGRIIEEDVRHHSQSSQSAVAEPVTGPISPVARRLAAELGVELQQVEGSGPGGRIVKQDIEAAAQRQASPAAPVVPTQVTPVVAAMPAAGVEIQALSGPRRVAAQRMTESFTTTPHFYLTAEVLAGALVRMREGLLPKIEATTGVRLTITDILVKICGHALSEHPEVNASWAHREGRAGVAHHRDVNVGIAVATAAGLMVPVLRHVDRLSLAEIAQGARGLIDRTRSGQATLQDLEGATFTISNLGMFAVDQFQAIINPPQSMILAVGRIRERPVVVDGAVVARPTMHLTVSADHRVLDGAQAAQFLERVAQLVEEPYLLLT